MKRFVAIVVCSLGVAAFATDPTPETAAWWAHVRVLAADNMEGRDTGSEGYVRAAKYIVSQFQMANLKPAGTKGYYQSVPLRSVELRTRDSSVELIRNGTTRLTWLQQITLAPHAGLPENLEAPLVFCGYALADAGARTLPIDVKGKVVVFLNAYPMRVAAPQQVQMGAQRQAMLRASGALGAIAIDNPEFVEAPRWPTSYARTVTVTDPAHPEAIRKDAFVDLRLSPEAADLLLDGSSHTFAQIMRLHTSGAALPTFDIPATLRLRLEFNTRDFASDNVVGTAPGSDPSFAKEYIVVSAHLDGYGYGEPVKGDRIYNGALDDAAYVAELIEFARHLKGHPSRRNILFAAFTGEEKGLRGSEFFTSHPPIPKEQLVADINLDMLRPIFPLKILTCLAVDESSLGATVREVGRSMGIEVRPDMEPERNLFRRADHYNFIRIGVPAVGFIFGYNPGSPEERVYRRWYEDRYHKPSDDVDQPIDFAAAAKFNAFFEKLATTVADADGRPTWNPNSPYKAAAQ
jgi:Zn-dependent M28 family amino/carboxypeptidase